MCLTTHLFFQLNKKNIANKLKRVAALKSTPLFCAAFIVRNDTSIYTNLATYYNITCSYSYSYKKNSTLRILMKFSFSKYSTITIKLWRLVSLTPDRMYLFIFFFLFRILLEIYSFIHNNVK